MAVFYALLGTEEKLAFTGPLVSAGLSQGVPLRQRLSLGFAYPAEIQPAIFIRFLTSSPAFIRRRYVLVVNYPCAFV